MANVWEAMKKHRVHGEVAPPSSETKEFFETAVAEEPGQEGVFIATVSAAAVKSEKAKALDIPRLHGAIKEPAKNYSEVLRAHYDRGGKISEDYRALRTSLLSKSQQEGFAYVITSAQAQEGKTVTCLNLAIVLAECADKSTVVVDCNLRQNQVATLTGITKTPGVAQLLREQASLREIIQPSVYPNLSFVSAGWSRPQEVAKLLSHSAMEQMIGDLRKLYDYVLIDTPPINSFADAGIVGRFVGQALLVVRIDRTKRESVDRAVVLLRSAGIKPWGAILTHRKHYIPSYLYRCA